MKHQTKRCECLEKGSFNFFCVQNRCPFQRRFCLKCDSSHHEAKHMIIKHNEDAYNIYAGNINNPQKVKIEQKLTNVLDIVTKKKKQSSQQINQILSEMNQLFQVRFINPLKTLLGTLYKSQISQKNKKIMSKLTHKDQLSVIAEQFRALKKRIYKQPEWIQNMSEYLTFEVSLFSQNIKKKIQEIKNNIKEIESLSPFSESIQENVLKKIQIKRQSLKDIILQHPQAFSKNIEQTKINFLKKMQKNVIGWNSQVSVQEWLQRKKIDEIQDLNLSNSNLDAIPKQLSLFTKLIRLDLSKKFVIEGGNKLKKIQNLQRLTNLQVLGLNNNQIVMIEGLNKLLRLQRLYLSGNKIEKLENIRHLTKLKNLSINGNPLTKISSEKDKINEMLARDININF